MRSELYELRSKALNSKLNEQSFKDNEEKTIYYTGLPNFLVLMQVFHHCENYISTTSLTVLGKFEQFILVLMRLRLNLPLKDLAYRFGISQPTVSRIWRKWINVLYKRTQFLIQWPERDLLQATMPMEFRKAFGTKVAVIIDCFELFIERSSNLLARAQTWSQYKHHNTVKFLIGIAPQGFVSYISIAVEASGILKKLLPGDVVIGYRGFNVEDSVGLYAASLKIPAFTRGKLQLSAQEVKETRKIASVRIHVERVIGLARRKYQILQSRAMPTEHMAVKPGETMALIDKIGVVCCALTNLSNSIVPID